MLMPALAEVEGSGRGAAGGDTNFDEEASVGPGCGEPGSPENLGDHTRLAPRFQQGEARPAGSSWGRQALGAVTLALALAWSHDPALADPVSHATLRAGSDLDGTYLWVGPVGAATHVEGAWDSAWGGTLHLIRIRERSWLGSLGAGIGAAHYAARDGGRVWVEALVGTRRLVGKMVGISVGPTVELGQFRHARAGVQASIWCFAGVVPYARGGVLDASGPFVEVGLSISLPAVRF